VRLKKAQIIVLRRTNYSEADRIINAITSDGYKISLIVKGVRKLRSKLVAAAELFTVSEVTYIVGKTDMHTVSSARIVNQYGSFLNDLEKVQAAYAVIKLVNKHTSESAGPVYFDILNQVFAALNSGLNAQAAELWAHCNMLKQAGHSLRLNRQANNELFVEKAQYNFDFESGGFLQSDVGVYTSEHIKLLKICHSQDINVLARVNNSANLSGQLNPFIKQFVESNT
jgi:DNA repair protein RecO (recombination protein O)